MKKHRRPECSDVQCSDVQCLNENILRIDLDDLEVEVLDQRLELALATLFGDGGVEAGEAPCGQFTCTGYMPGGRERPLVRESEALVLLQVGKPLP